MCSLTSTLFIENLSDLKFLFLRFCPNLKVKGSFNKLIHLEKLTIDYLKMIESFSFSPRLKFLKIAGLDQVEVLDFNFLCEMKSLSISFCHNLKTLSIDGLIDLESLEVRNNGKEVQIKGSFQRLEKAKKIMIRDLDKPSKVQLDELKQLSSKNDLVHCEYNDFKINREEI